LLVPIIGIGLYPRILTDSYRASIEALVQRETLAMAKVIHPPTPGLIRLSPMAELLPQARLQAPALAG